MAANRKIDQALAKLSLEQREREFRHHSYDEDMGQYDLMKAGKLEEAVRVGREMFEGPTTGSLSDDPVMNYKYLFVASITLACRFCIEGGLPPETAFNLSDLYIRQVDKCRTVEEIFELHNTMFRDYTLRMQEMLRQDVFSRPIHLALDYIDQHLQQPMTVEAVAQAIGLSPSYLSTLFKKETGQTPREFRRHNYRKHFEDA